MSEEIPQVVTLVRTVTPKGAVVVPVVVTRLPRAERDLVERIALEHPQGGVS